MADGKEKEELNGSSDAQKLKEMNRKRAVSLKSNSTIDSTSITNNTINKKRSWWHRALARPRVQWTDWTIDSLP